MAEGRPPVAVPWPARSLYSRTVEDWFQQWFDADYAALYAHRDAAEAAQGVQTALCAAPELAEGWVLDLACGSGRHLEALRAHNPSAFGLDLSRELLAAATPGTRPWLLQADMRRLPVRPGCLRGICLWFTPFGYFDDGENRAMVRELGSCLAPGGVLWLDYLNAPALRDSLSAAPEVVERGGLRATVRRSLEGHRVVKRIRLEPSAGGVARDVVESVHLYDPEQLEEIGAAAGLHLRSALGDYHGGAYRTGSERWIGIFVK